MATDEDSESLLDVLGAGKKRRRRSASKRKPNPARTPADANPIAHVMLDEQAAHLGRTFDYLISQKYDAAARPGAYVRVRFGAQLLNGFIWSRDDKTDVEPGSLRFLKNVLSVNPVLDAGMRRDIETIASHFGGTVPNILRVAVPPRVAYADAQRGDVQKRQRWSQRIIDADEAQTERIRTQYDGAEALARSIESPGEEPEIIWDSLPGASTWAQDVAWAALHAMRAGRQVVVVLPDTRHVAEVAAQMRSFGLQSFGPIAAPQAAQTGQTAQPAQVGPADRKTQTADPEGTAGADTDGDATPSRPSQPAQWWRGDFVVMLSSMQLGERYRAYLAMVDGAVRCAIGARGVMYTPVGGNPLFILVDDMVYQNADGFLPYASARGVLQVRARNHHGTLIIAGHARSAQSQWDADKGIATLQVHPTAGALESLLPRMLWLNREELESRLDPTVGSRVPTTAVQIMRHALPDGPVLFSLPADSEGDTLACAECRTPARCARCSGPIVRDRRGAVVCAWCGALVGEFRCRECGATRLRAVHVGASGTVQELSKLFRGLPFIVSSQVHGTVPHIPNEPAIVVATPWFEPFVDGGDYRAVAILDAWMSGYRRGLDASVDSLVRWMHAASLCIPASQGGTVMLLGDTLETLGESLVSWDPCILGRREIEERSEACFPPSVTVAVVWGARDAVMAALDQMGAIDGDFSTIASPDGDMPSLLGPIPIPPQRGAGELEEMENRVRAVVRVPNERADELAWRLHVAEAGVAARGYRSELKFQMYPKDLI